MDDWVQVLLGKKYSPNQPRDSHGRFGGGGGSISPTQSPRLSSELASTESRLMNLPDKENAAIFDKDGNTLYYGYGSKSSVVIPQPLIMSGRLEGATLTHNHPSGTSFSRDDVDLAIRSNMREIRAVGVNPETGEKVLYKMSAGKKGWPKRETLQVIADDFSKTQESEWWKRIDRGEMTVKEAEATHNHNVWKKVADNFGLNYSYEGVE